MPTPAVDLLRRAAGRKKLAARLARRGIALSGGLLTVTLVERAAGVVPPDLAGPTIRMPTYGVAFSPDGTRLAVAGEDKLVRVYALNGADPTPAKPAAKEVVRGDGLNARQAAEAFLGAAVAGKVDEARAHADPDRVSANKVKELAGAGLKRVDVSVALAGDTDALVISEPVEVGKEGKGHILLQLRKREGRWRVRDIDFEPAEKALRKQRDFLEAHPEAKAVPAGK